MIVYQATLVDMNVLKRRSNPWYTQNFNEINFLGWQQAKRLKNAKAWYDQEVQKAQKV